MIRVFAIVIGHMADIFHVAAGRRARRPHAHRVGELLGMKLTLKAGEVLPVYERAVTTEQLVRFAGASSDFSRQHWDPAFMIENGFPGVLVHG